MTLRTAFATLTNRPFQTLVLRWNWKTALLSSISRSLLFLLVNLGAGCAAATAAMTAELMYRGLMAGFYGSVTQTFRKVQPHWQASLAVFLLVPTVSHSLEYLVHRMNGTPKLLGSIGASVCFTGISTLFHLHSMRKEVFVVGAGSPSLGADLQRLPEILTSLVIEALREAARRAHGVGMRTPVPMDRP